MSPTKILSLGVCLSLASTAFAQDKNLCVYDPAGAAGTVFQIAQEFQIEAKAKGESLKLIPYTDEATAAADLTAGQCDAAMLTGVRARQYGLPTATIEAMGALTTYPLLRTTISLLAKEKAASLSLTDSYANAGIYPAGSVYLYVRDRSWTQKSDLAGKRIATLDFDEASKTMVDTVGASKVPADIGTFAGMFNNGAVDICYAPATAYSPLELYRGLTSGGGVIKFPLGQLTIQVVARRDRFDDTFTAWARTYAAGKFSSSLSAVQRTEAEVDDKYWVTLPEESTSSYDSLFQGVRVKLRDAGVYNGTILKLMRRVRCQADAARAECASSPE